MRDYKIVAVESQGIDIDIIDGEPEYLDYESQTGDQRAALAAYAVKGTLPGALDYGVSWGEVYSGQSSVSQLSNEVQLQIQNEAGASSENTSVTANQYQGLVATKDGDIGVIIMRG